MHESIEARVGVFMPFVGEVEGEHGGFELGMPQVALDEPRIDPGFQQMGGIRMPEGRDGDTCQCSKSGDGLRLMSPWDSSWQRPKARSGP